MNVTVAALGAIVAVAAAVRSTWSPCGQSMLSQLTPVGEASRGYRYRNSAAWYVAGSVVGGATLGAVTALLAAGVAALSLTSGAALALVAGLAALSAGVDAGTFGFAPPFFLRQVNEDWLGKYRAWLYSSGFGWQVGAGVATYIMTAAVFLTIAIGTLSGEPVAAFALGVLFGFVRGLAVFLTAGRRTTAALFDLHRRFDALGEPVRRAVIGIQLAVAVVAVGAAFGIGAAAAAVAVTLVPVVWFVFRARRREPSAA